MQDEYYMVDTNRAGRNQIQTPGTIAPPDTEEIVALRQKLVDCTATFQGARKHLSDAVLETSSCIEYDSCAFALQTAQSAEQHASVRSRKAEIALKAARSGLNSAVRGELSCYVGGFADVFIDGHHPMGVIATEKSTRSVRPS